ncbi:MAG: hypothetical protein Tsb0014_04430 [Pleurocapsa sp.]
MLETPDYKWKTIAAIKFRANNKVSETQFARISNALSIAIKNFDAKNIGILPPTWRNPQYCALGVIYAIWLMGYSGEFISKSSYPEVAATYYPNPQNVIFKIISQTGTGYFEEVLENDCQIMWSFLKKLNNKNKDNFLSFDYQELKKMRIQFNVTKKCLAEKSD